MTDVRLNLLVVEDDPHVRHALREALREHAAEVIEASTAEEGLSIASRQSLDAIVLDLGLPDQPGLSLCRAVRGISSVPIIVLSAAHDEQDKVALLDAGADDFVSKPCGAGELLARVRGQIRRASLSTVARSWSRVSVDGVEIDLIEQRVVRHGAPQRLTPTEWALLRALVLHAGRPLSPKQLWDIVWAREFGDYATHVRVHMTHLRRKVEPDPSMPRLIVTEPGVGYRFAGPR